MVKVVPNKYYKSFILEHFRAVKLKVFFNHGESIPQQSFKSGNIVLKTTLKNLKLV